MVRDLEQVDARQAFGEERWVDAFLDITHQQEAARPDVTEEHDRDVVDAGPAVRGRCRHLAADRPQDPQVDLVDCEAVARGD